MMATRTTEERLASIEATLPHLATKVNLSELKTELKDHLLKFAFAAAGYEVADRIGGRVQVESCP